MGIGSLYFNVSCVPINQINFQLYCIIIYYYGPMPHMKRV